MEQVKSSIVDGILLLSLSGRISSDNSNQIDSEIQAIKKGYIDSRIIIDMENLEYISSAGLRVILKIRKDHKDAKIINASNDIYDIFEMTGFTEMMTIEKAFRKVSIDGCEIIGRGANGLVYRLNSDTIIKVYVKPDSLSDIKRERELARKAFVLGIPTAISYDIVKVGDSYGSVFELLNASSFAEILKNDPSSIEKISRMSVDLLKKIHETRNDKEDIPKAKDQAIKWVEFIKDYLPLDTFNKLYSMVTSISDTDYIIHGDYHAKNIMLQDNEAILIDMDTISRGNKIFEFAAIYSAYVGFNEIHPEMSIPILGIDVDTCKRLWDIMIHMYFANKDESYIKNFTDKAATLSYIRILRKLVKNLNKGNRNFEKDIDIYKNKLIYLVNSLDSLEV